MDATQNIITLDDFLAISEAERIELVGGEIVEMVAAGGRHQLVGSNVSFALNLYVRQRDIGIVLHDGMTYLMNSPATGLKDSFVPDISFIAHENIPTQWDIDKPHPSVPDLAIEIISQSERAETIQQKVRTYLREGTQEVWLVYPTSGEVHQFTRTEADKSTIYTQSAQTIKTDLLPDLILTLETIFKLPRWAIKEDVDSDTNN